MTWATSISLQTGSRYFLRFDVMLIIAYIRHLFKCRSLKVFNKEIKTATKLK